MQLHSLVAQAFLALIMRLCEQQFQDKKTNSLGRLDNVSAARQGDNDGDRLNSLRRDAQEQEPSFGTRSYDVVLT